MQDVLCHFLVCLTDEMIAWVKMLDRISHCVLLQLYHDAEPVRLCCHSAHVSSCLSSLLISCNALNAFGMRVRPCLQNAMRQYSAGTVLRYLDCKAALCYVVDLSVSAGCLSRIRSCVELDLPAVQPCLEGPCWAPSLISL